MKAIFINATEKTVTEIDIKGDLQSWYDTMGVEAVEAIYTVPGKNMLLVDEEGLFKPKETPCFSFGLTYPLIVGNGLVVGTKGSNATHVSVPIDQIKSKIIFFSR